MEEPKGVLDERNYRRIASKTKKQLKEKRRRGRIGDALEELKKLVYEKKDKKVDKVEVLEHTVNFIQDKKKRDDQAAYLMGYNACLIELTDFLMQASKLDYTSKMTFLAQIAALSTRVEQHKQSIEQNGMALQTAIPENFVMNNQQLRDTIADDLDDFDGTSATSIMFETEEPLCKEASFQNTCTASSMSLQLPGNDSVEYSNYQQQTQANTFQTFTNGFQQSPMKTGGNFQQASAVTINQSIGNQAINQQTINQPGMNTSQPLNQVTMTPTKNEQMNTAMQNATSNLTINIYASPQQGIAQYAQTPQKDTPTQYPSTPQKELVPYTQNSNTELVPYVNNTPLKTSSQMNQTPTKDTQYAQSPHKFQNINQNSPCGKLNLPVRNLSNTCDFFKEDAVVSPLVSNTINSPAGDQSTFYQFPNMNKQMPLNSPVLKPQQQQQFNQNRTLMDEVSQSKFLISLQHVMQEMGYEGVHQLSEQQLSELEHAHFACLQNGSLPEGSLLPPLNVFMKRMYGVTE